MLILTLSSDVELIGRFVWESSTLLLRVRSFVNWCILGLAVLVFSAKYLARLVFKLQHLTSRVFAWTMEGESSIKAFLYAFLRKQNVTPEYSVRPVGPKHRQRFLCELRVPNYGYTGTKWELYCRLENPKRNSLDTRWSFRNVFTIFWRITVFPRFKYY